jgi:hypothetical protein
VFVSASAAGAGTELHATAPVRRPAPTVRDRDDDVGVGDVHEDDRVREVVEVHASHGTSLDLLCGVPISGFARAVAYAASKAPRNAKAS